MWLTGVQRGCDRVPRHLAHSGWYSGAVGVMELAPTCHCPAESSPWRWCSVHLGWSPGTVCCCVHWTVVSRCPVGRPGVPMGAKARCIHHPQQRQVYRCSAHWSESHYCPRVGGEVVSLYHREQLKHEAEGIREMLWLAVVVPVTRLCNPDSPQDKNKHL